MKNYAVITGASAGLGTEFAKQLAAKGYKLILTARREDRLKNLAMKPYYVEVEGITIAFVAASRAEKNKMTPLGYRRFAGDFTLL